MSRSRDRERLRQERVAFDQQQIHYARLFRLKLLFGYLALGLFTGISVLAALFAIDAKFSPTSIAVSGSVFVGNATSLAVFVIKWVLRPDDLTVLRPLIGIDRDAGGAATKRCAAFQASTHSASGEKSVGKR